MNKLHHYKTNVEWTGNRGDGTTTYTAYDRAHSISAAGKEVVRASSDPAFRGDPTRYNPEELLLASLSSCHMLWYLHLCADNGVVVMAYSDDAKGTMQETSGSGHFTEVVLHPTVTVREASMIEKAKSLHTLAHQSCFIANSVNFSVKHEVIVNSL